MMFSRLNETIDDALDVCDGIVLTGGRDIEPMRYGQDPHPYLGTTDPHRDEFELELARSAFDRAMPMIAICRGMQVLNVALGGTLFQDVALTDSGSSHPTDPELVFWDPVVEASLSNSALPPHPRHEVRIVPGSRLHSALDVNSIDVSSFHHQAVDLVPPCLHVTATSADGIIEALEAEHFVIAMQCELHEDWRVHSIFLNVFTAFIDASRAYAKNK